MDMPLSDMLSLALVPYFGFVLFIMGLYSATVNVTDARRLNHKRAETFARTGGWCYIIIGTAIIFYRLVF
jgi:hypothetical protein